MNVKKSCRKNAKFLQMGLLSFFIHGSNKIFLYNFNFQIVSYVLYNESEYKKYLINRDI